MFEISEVEGGTCTIYVVKTKVAISCIYMQKTGFDVARMSLVTRKPTL